MKPSPDQSLVMTRLEEDTEKGRLQDEVTGGEDRGAGNPHPLGAVLLPKQGRH